ncbi:MAG: NAD(P)/FAD-dependent oxidoreductase [Bacteroidetes bacterium]|nr:MAG: NAD(P)/FAD-dependent oxidoreductase [Bacteroidota bacterium]
MPPRLLVAGGGAAGFFGAVVAAEACPGLAVMILEQGHEVLGKVRISGGGRCNLTHACWDPKELVQAYPRGQRELLGPFHKFGPADTVAWFGDRGVETKVEADGRMFPVSDQSQSVVDCLQKAARAAGVVVRTRTAVQALRPREGAWEVSTARGPLYAERLLVATGSSARMWKLLGELGHQMVPPVPSLFTFNIRDPRLEGLAGVSVPQAEVSLPALGMSQSGPLLITHWGLSGPAVLKLSAIGARALEKVAYRFELVINWCGQSPEAVMADLETARRERPRKKVVNHSLGAIPQRLWERMVQQAGVAPGQTWAQLRRKEMTALLQELTAARLRAQGKSTFKEEFVTAGGVSLREVDFRRFESRVWPGLHLAGEVLDIDAVTGGYNFQAAWTGGWLAGQAIAADLAKSW